MSISPQKLPVNIPVIPSIRYLNHVFPELGFDANATAGSICPLLKTVVKFSHCLSVGHGQYVLEKLQNLMNKKSHYTCVMRYFIQTVQSVQVFINAVKEEAKYSVYKNLSFHIMVKEIECVIRSYLSTKLKKGSSCTTIKHFILNLKA